MPVAKLNTVCNCTQCCALNFNLYGKRENTFLNVEGIFIKHEYHPKRQYPTATLHDVTTQKTSTWNHKISKALHVQVIINIFYSSS